MQNKLNFWWAAAGLMSLAVSLLHIFGGGPAIMVPLAQIEMPPAIYAIMEVIWHQVSLLLILAGLALLLAAKRGARAMDMVLFINVLYFGITVIFIVAGLYYLGSLWPMPQWVLFGPMVIIAQIGWQKQKGRVQ